MQGKDSKKYKSPKNVLDLTVLVQNNFKDS
jgi:hypothetical protein